MPNSLPSRPNLEQLKNQAKDLLKSHREGDPQAAARFRASHPRWAGVPESEILAARSSLSDAQLVVAREYGFASWPKLKEHVLLLLEEGDPLEQLKKAFHPEDAPLFRELLERYPEFKARLNDPIGPFDSPIITLVRTREMLDVLLEAGADLNAKSRWWAGGFGLLHNAEPDLAMYAIQRGATVDVHAAARLGLIDRLRELVLADPTLVHARGGDGQTPLHFASTIEIARFLLDLGADIDARDVDHESTPAQHMVRDRPDVARYLVQRGCHTDILLAAALGENDHVRRHLDADPNCINARVDSVWFPMTNPKAGGTIYQWTLGFHVSPHDVARQFKHPEVLSLLMERSPAEVQLLAACWAADESLVQSLLAEHPGLAVRLTSTSHIQVAHAARNNNLAAVHLMLAAGWPVDAVGQHRATPLHWSAFHGNLEMVREILRYHPPLEQSDADFKGTPLGWALHGSEHGWYSQTGNYPTTVEALLNAGAKFPEKIAGTPAVQEVLRRYQARA